ncbi:hypothetical protein FF38_02394 [Lucilia cuprina]|uniref:Uncharacterized protein n=1 Tax=Lucilia cuprina TaxID=7375 RepID=A0A0L0CAK2_LUCCU|nr:hypothetical protein FF38_02394 [Lucilia cuprina]
MAIRGKVYVILVPKHSVEVEQRKRGKLQIMQEPVLGSWSAGETFLIVHLHQFHSQNITNNLRDDRKLQSVNLKIQQHILAIYYANSKRYSTDSGIQNSTQSCGQLASVVAEYLVIWLDTMPNNSKPMILLTSPVYSPGRLDLLVASLNTGMVIRWKFHQGNMPAGDIY